MTTDDGPVTTPVTPEGTDEIDRLRSQVHALTVQLEYADKATRQWADQFGGLCVCDHNPETTQGPEEDCPLHGREELQFDAARYRADMYELAEAWGALPASVQGDAAPDGTPLAGRIEAVVAERDHARGGFRHCHERHRRLEPVVRDLLDALADGGLYASAPGAWHERTKKLATETNATLSAPVTVPAGGPTLTVCWDDDEHVTLLLGGRAIGIVSHESSGWDGMRDVIGIATAMAQALCLSVVTEGVPNL